MKTFFFILLSFSFSLSAQDNNSYYFKHHKISLPINNRGVLADVEVDSNQTQMRFKDSNVIYSSGFLLSGFSNDTLWTNGVLSASRIEDYVSGSYKHSEYDNLAMIYILKSTDQPFGESWQSWKDAVKLGADFYDGNGDGIYDPVDKNSNGKWDAEEDRPDLLGDQTAWCVYKDAVPSDLRTFTNIKPQGMEIQQTVFASSINENFDNTIFVRYRIENTGLVTELLDSVYFSIWSDPDVGNAMDDLVGCDTTIDAGYVYQIEPDEYFEVNTPSVIIQYAQGPISFLPGVTFIDHNNNGIFDSTDTPLSIGYNNKGSVLGADKITGAVNLKMSSFSNFLPTGPTEPTFDETHYRSKMLGYTLQWEELLDPCDDYFEVIDEDCSKTSPYYWYSGNPVVNKGWINTKRADQRITINTGPFQLIKNKPVDIVVAYTVGEAEIPLKSLKTAKINARNVQFYFRNNAFESVEDNLVVVVPEPVSNFRLEQNYPNPFNPSTIINYTVPSSDVPQNVTLKAYNLLGQVVAVLVNEIQPAGNYTAEFSAEGFSSGVYFYTLRNGDKYESRKMMLLH